MLISQCFDDTKRHQGACYLCVCKGSVEHLNENPSDFLKKYRRGYIDVITDSAALGLKQH